jgi:UDP-N-acetylglucosamine 4,6-dehydratase
MKVAITGGTGSLGRAIIARLVTTRAATRIVAFSRDEQKRAQLARDFPEAKVYAGDVRDLDRLEDIFSGCDTVVHGAARKVVTAHPDEAEEMLKTNVLGSQNVITAARRCGVARVVMVSSDKAVRAENVYGVSKAMMEHLAVNANARTVPAGTRVGVVRYGNVLGSTGSVVPKWREQVRSGRPMTLVGAEMTRFWITLDAAVDLVLAAIHNLRGGEIVVPHLVAANIETVARAVAMSEVGVSAGLTWPTTLVSDAPMEKGGARQGGEKLHEELLSAAEARRVIIRGNYYVVPPYQHADMWDNQPWVGDGKLPPDTVYRSDVWPYRAGPQTLRDMLTGDALKAGGVR